MYEKHGDGFKCVNCGVIKKVESRRNCTSGGPSVTQMAKNFAKAAGNYIKSGGENVTEEEHKKRLSVCSTCEFKKGPRCIHSKCGCFIEVKAKWASEHCPIDKW